MFGAIAGSAVVQSGRRLVADIKFLANEKGMFHMQRIQSVALVSDSEV